MRIILLTCILVFINACHQDEDPIPTQGTNKKDQLTPEQSLALKKASQQEFSNSIKNYLQQYVEESKNTRNSYIGNTDTSTAAPSVPEAGAVATGGGGANYSGTNTIVQGVDEANLSQTDGEYLYVGKQAQANWYVGGGVVGSPGVAVSADALIAPSPYPQPQQTASIRIFRLNNNTPDSTEIAQIELPEDHTQLIGFYLVQTPTEKSLLVVSNRYIADTTTTPVANTSGAAQTTVTKKANGRSAAFYYPYRTARTVLSKYSLTDASAPELQWRYEITGSQITTRRVGQTIYLLSSKSLVPYQIMTMSTEQNQDPQDLINALDVNTLMPETWINGEASNLVQASDCIVPHSHSATSIYSWQLLTVNAIPLDAPQNTTSLCTTEYSYNVYLGENSLYLLKDEYSYMQDSQTIIHKIALDATSMHYQASGRVPGNAGRDFFLNEHNNDFRLLTSSYWSLSASGERVYQPYHRLFVLRESAETSGKLDIIGQLPNAQRPQAIGKPGERIYSTRFTDNYAYVVTFQKVDPLYAINLQDSNDPYIEGELELPGFSDYLHPFGDDLLLGVGKGAQTWNGTTWYQEVKVGLFDVSDKSNPQQVDSYSFGKRGSNSPTSYQHHTFTYLYEADKQNIKIAFPIQVHEELQETQVITPNTYYGWSYSGLFLFDLSLQSNRLNHSGTMVVDQLGTGNNHYWKNLYNSRSIIVNGNVHYINNGDVKSANWDQPNEIVTPTILTYALNDGQLQLSKPLDYLEVRSASTTDNSNFTQLRQYSPAIYDSLDSLQLSNLQNTFSDSGFRYNANASEYYYLASLKDQDVKLIRNTSQLLALLGDIDTLEEASLWVWANGFDLATDEMARLEVTDTGYLAHIVRESFVKDLKGCSKIIDYYQLNVDQTGVFNYQVPLSRSVLPDQACPTN